MYKALYYAAFEQMLLYYFRHILNRNKAVERSLGVDDNYRPLGAQAEAARLYDFYLFGKPLLADFLLKQCQYFFGRR